MKNYVIEEAQKVLTLKALIEDVQAMERTKMLIEERTQGSIEIIQQLSEEFMSNIDTDTIYEVFYNLKTDEQKEHFPNGRNVTDVTQKLFDEMKEDTSIEVIHFNKFNLAKLVKILEV